MQNQIVEMQSGFYLFYLSTLNIGRRPNIDYNRG